MEVFSNMSANVDFCMSVLVCVCAHTTKQLRLAIVLRYPDICLHYVHYVSFTHIIYMCKLQIFTLTLLSLLTLCFTISYNHCTAHPIRKSISKTTGHFVINVQSLWYLIAHYSSHFDTLLLKFLKFMTDF